MIKLSASSMDSYKKCPRKYYYRYIEKPDIEIPEWPHLEFGTTAHRVLELFHEYLIKNVVAPDRWPELMRACFKKALKESAEREKFELIKPELPYLRKIIQDYLNVMKRDGLPPVIHNELDFKIMVGGFLVRGFMDRIDRPEPGVYRIVDYKTNKNPDYLTVTQLAIYALALKEKYDDVEHVSGAYVLLKHESEEKEFDLGPEVLESTREKILKVGRDINTETEWEKKPTFLCNWCDYKSICQDSWSQDNW